MQVCNVQTKPLTDFVYEVLVFEQGSYVGHNCAMKYFGVQSPFFCEDWTQFLCTQRIMDVMSFVDFRGALLVAINKAAYDLVSGQDGNTSQGMLFLLSHNVCQLQIRPT